MTDIEINMISEAQYVGCEEGFDNSLSFDSYYTSSAG